MKEALSPEKTTNICKRLTKVDISNDLFKLMASSLKKGNILSFLSNHQGYLETEMWMMVSKELQTNVNSNGFKGLCWPYSEPATVANAGEELSKREKYYEDNGLKLLPFIRDIDRAHPKYKNYITNEMEDHHKKSISFLRNIFKGNYGIILTPEGSIEGGRKNEETNKVKGIIQITDYTFTDLLLRKENVDIVPVGVSGSYKVFSSTTYKFSEDIPLWLQNNEIIMSISAREIIPVKSLIGENNKIDYLFYNYVAPLLPYLEEQGHYAPRTNLENIF